MIQPRLFFKFRKRIKNKVCDVKVEKERIKVDMQSGYQKEITKIIKWLGKIYGDKRRRKHHYLGMDWILKKKEW